VNDGDFAGSSGNITVVDSNSLEVAESIALRSLDNNALVAGAALDFGSDTIDRMGDLSSDAINAVGEHSARAMREVSDSSRYAIDSMADVSDVAISSVTDISDSALDELSESTQVFSDNLSATTKTAMAVNSQILEQTAANNTQDKEIIAQLAKSTSLAGQDIVAESSQKMTMYMAIAVSIIGLGLVFMSARGRV
jgi:hypothetical protein